jgi:cyclophilin family peptidyl-prolyl cis-trans isomerase
MTGHLQVNVNAPDSKVYVDGAWKGVASPAAPLNLEDLPMGAAQVRAEAPGHGPAQQQVQIQRGQWTQAMLVLDRVAVAARPAAVTGHPRVQFATTEGKFTVELDAEAAPKTVAHFLGYVRSGFYAGTIFHRVIKSFMIQGGGLTATGQEKPAGTPVENESLRTAGLGWKHQRGTIAMARAAAPHGAQAQFFLNVVDNAFLDQPQRDGFGYCVFGRVVEGMETVDRIQGVRTGAGDKPLQPVQILEAVVAGEAAAGR